MGASGRLGLEWIGLRVLRLDWIREKGMVINFGLAESDEEGGKGLKT